MMYNSNVYNNSSGSNPFHMQPLKKKGPLRASWSEDDDPDYILEGSRANNAADQHSAYPLSLSYNGASYFKVNIL